MSRKKYEKCEVTIQRDTFWNLGSKTRRNTIIWQLKYIFDDSKSGLIVRHVKILPYDPSLSVSAFETNEKILFASLSKV